MNRPANPYPMMRPGKPRFDRESGYKDGWDAAKAGDAPRLEAADKMAQAVRVTMIEQAVPNYLADALHAYDAAKKGEANG